MKNKKYETALVIGDFQIPFQDDKAINLVFKLIEKEKFDRIFINGDFVDCYDLSTFDKDPENFKGRFDNEIKVARQYLTRLRVAAPKAKITYIFGNHEYRLKRYLMRNAKEIYQFVKLEDLLGLKALDIELVDSGLNESFTEYGNILIGHFDVAREHSAYTAKSLVEKFGQSIVQSHTHRLGMFFKTTNKEELVGVECGCLCIKGEYQIIPNWQTGFMIIKKELGGNNDFFIPVHMRNYSFIYNNHLYK